MSFGSKIAFRRNICSDAFCGVGGRCARATAALLYSEIGRRSVDPELMMRMLIFWKWRRRLGSWRKAATRPSFDEQKSALFVTVEGVYRSE